MVVLANSQRPCCISLKSDVEELEWLWKSNGEHESCYKATVH